MSKLSQTEFGTLLELAGRADLEQRLDLTHFIAMEPDEQAFVMKLIAQTKITKSIKAGHEFVETPTHDTAGEKKENTKGKRGGRVAKPLKILAPQGCKMDEDIPFSMDRFGKWLNQKGMKSTRTYVMGVNSMLKNLGMANMAGITIFGLKAVRDSIAGQNKTDMGKRVWLKKFNSYIVHEYEAATQKQA